MKTLVFLFSSLVLTGTVFATGQINIAYSPYTISQPGSYIVVTNLTTQNGKDTIEINASDVTIDLNGHTLFGPGTTAVSGGAGIVCGSGDNITITNGSIRNYNSYGILLSAANAHISKMKIVNCTIDGIHADGGIIENNLVSQIGGAGISCINSIYPAVIANNVVTHTNGFAAIEANSNSAIKGNTVNNNGSSIGIWSGGNCTITGNNITGNHDGIQVYNGGNIIGNTVASNSFYGIYVYNGCKISDNVVYSNGGIGITSLTGCTLTGNNVYSNGSTGISAGSGCTLTENNINGNGSDGLQVGSGSLIRGNSLRSNGNFGLSANGGSQIENNNFSSNTVGMYVSGSNNSIQNNSLWTNSTGLWISGGHNFFAGNSLRGNTSVDTAIAANNTAGNGTTGFVNIVVP